MEAQRSPTREEGSWRLVQCLCQDFFSQDRSLCLLPCWCNCPSAVLSPSSVDGRGQHPKPRCRGEEARAPDSVKGCWWGRTSVVTSLFQQETGKPPAPTPITQRSPRVSSFSSSTTHYIFCQPQMGPKLHIVATKPQAWVCRAWLEGS